jgi:hypothetical protein
MTPAALYAFQASYFSKFELAWDMFPSCYTSLIVYGLVVHVVTVLLLYWQFEDHMALRTIKGWMAGLRSREPKLDGSEVVFENPIAVQEEGEVEMTDLYNKL